MALTPMLIGGDWRSAVGIGRTEDVTSPYDGSIVGTVPVAGREDVGAALAAAEAGAARWRRTPAHARMKILLRAAELADERAGDIAKIISSEAGKTITERADLMPYGGLKGSGIGKEGPRWAVEEMTELKTVILHGRPW
jgi:acyl-CoA reductase-like NAD-dependent aldehyde dehydrogenase